MFLAIKHFTQKNLNFLYTILRPVIMPLYVRIRNRKLKQFSVPLMYDFTLDDVSFKIKLDPQNGFVDQEIFWKGVYEEDILNLFKNNIHEGDVVLDIGANIGEHTLYASQLVGTTGKVYSFEPNTRLADQVRESLKANNSTNTTVYSFGLGDAKNAKELFVNKNNIGGSSLIDQGRGDPHVTVQIEVGDDVLVDVSKVDFIKIDIEGYEYNALKGLTKIIEKYKPAVILEYSPELYAQNGTQDGMNILEFFATFGYAFIDTEDFDNANKVYRTKEEIIAWGKNFGRPQTNIFFSTKI